MNTFDILAKETNIHRNTLLEASAGTGKTFTIEHLVIRLLTAPTALTIDQILVVTFTKLATNELTIRLHNSIQRALLELKTNEIKTAYLQDLVDVKRAIRQLEAALTCYSQLQVFTIHAFCEKSLQEGRFLVENNTALHAGELLEEEDIRQVIRDTFREGVTKENFSLFQIKRLGDVEEKLVKLLKQSREITPLSSLAEQITRFQTFFKENPQEPQAVLEECLQLAPFYKKIQDRNGHIHEEIRKSFSRFAELFGKNTLGREDFELLLQDGLPFVTLFSEENKKVRAEVPSTVLSNFREKCRRELLPLVEEARSPAAILSRIGRECQQRLQKRLQEREKFRFDDLLFWLRERIQSPLFAEALRERYRAVIIDEFQDTDSIQWSIFRDLFYNDPKKRSHLYLVGDPKQSIYGFRQADIYTYLAAAEVVGDVSSLATNFRSTKALVASLNHLFSLPDLFLLPKVNRSLPYHHVRVGREESEGTGIHYYLVKESCKPKVLEEEYLFPAITREICKSQVPLSSWAILVSDRYQADRFAAFCEKICLPYTLQRKRLLTESPIYEAVHDLLLVLQNPRDFSALKRVLGGSLLKESDLKLKALDEEELLSAQFLRFENFRQIALEKGLTPFFKAFLTSLSLSASEEADLMQLVDLLAPNKNNISQAIQFLEKGELIECEDNEESEGVKILTIHASKGLEFDYVFPVGLATEPRENEQFITTEEQKIMPVVEKQDPRYLQHLEECEAERRRQFYVACTRAREKLFLYLPTYYLEHFHGDIESLIAWVKKDAGATIQWLERSEPPPCFVETTLPVEKSLQRPLSIHFSPVPVVSFTSLAKVLTAEKGAPQDFAPIEKNKSTLPAGKEIGIILHTLLEKLPEIPTIAMVQAATKNTRYVGWEEVIWKLLQEVLTSPLEIKGETIILSEIPESECYKEMEFFYQETNENRFVKGVIDLLFCYNGKIYLLDWKSNWLPQYTQEAILEEMKENNYFEQARLYREAASRYFPKILKKQFEELFGGTIYHFLRGGAVWFSPK